MSYQKVQISIDGARAIINQVSKPISQKASKNPVYGLLLGNEQVSLPLYTYSYYL